MVFFFFFQAEDGIRDVAVTGVQTCALPILTATQAPLLISGALVTESIFSWPGMGRLFLDTLTTRDYPVMMAVLMLTAFLVVLSNLIGDALVALADPRVRFR